MVVSLHAGLGRILEEGLDAVHARHAEAGRLLHEGLAELGLELFAAEGHRLPELTTVKVPDGVDSAAVRKELLERYDLEIGAGVGPYAATVWRIGPMGDNATPDKVLLVLAALKEYLRPLTSRVDHRPRVPLVRRGEGPNSVSACRQTMINRRLVASPG